MDAFDSTRIWYASTVVDKKTQKEDDNEYIYLKIGFRTYHPEGNREDNNKEKFFGWSESFDEWIPAFNPRIQKFNTFAKSFEESNSQLGNQKEYEDTIDDQMDILLYSKDPLQSVYAVGRKKCRSGLLVLFLNQFGVQGGY